MLVKILSFQTFIGIVWVLIDSATTMVLVNMVKYVTTVTSPTSNQRVEQTKKKKKNANIRHVK